MTAKLVSLITDKDFPATEAIKMIRSYSERYGKVGAKSSSDSKFNVICTRLSTILGNIADTLETNEPKAFDSVYKNFISYMEFNEVDDVVKEANEMYERGEFEELFTRIGVVILDQVAKMTPALTMIEAIDKIVETIESRKPQTEQKKETIH